MDDDLQQKIAAALEQKVPMSEIAARLASHENPEYSAYGKSFMESQAAPSTRRSDYQEPQKNLAGTITPFLDLINENPKTALGVGAAALAVPFAIKTKNAIEDRRMKRELHESEIAKNAAYAKQVDLQAQKLTTPAELTHTDVANMMKQERNVTGKPNPLAASFEQKFGMPLAEAEQLSGGKITNAIDAEIVGKALTKGQGLSVNPIPGVVSNQPAGIPSAVSPMDRLTQQPPTPQMIQPKPPTAVDTLAAGGAPTQIATQTAAQEIDALTPVASKLTKQEQGMMNHLLGTYGGKDSPFAHEAYNKVKEILGYTPAYPEGKGGSLAKEETGKILGYRKEAIPGPKINLTHEMKSILRKGGPAAAALIATTEFANAKTPEEKANAGANLLGAILPPGMDINPAGTPGVQQSQISNAALLGSPYAQTEWAKTQRLREKAGAGRGIMPPSAYQR